MKQFMAFLLLFGLISNGGCGGADKPVSHFQVLGYVYDFDWEVEMAAVELWTLDGATMLASTDVVGVRTPFIFPESDKLKGRLLLKANVPGFGTMMNVIDTRQPNIEAVTPLSTLILEAAKGDYSEDGIDYSERAVAKFVGVPESDEYSMNTLIGVIPLDPESKLRAFDPTRFSYEKFQKGLLLGEDADFNEAIAIWAENVRNEKPTLTPSLVESFNDVDGSAAFAYILKFVAKGAGHWAEHEALGWILNLITGGGESAEILHAIKEMSKKLDEIQRSLYRLECDIKEILSRMAVDITHIGMKPNLDAVQTAYNFQLMEIASGDMSKQRRVQLAEDFVAYHKTRIDIDMFGIDSGIQTTASGGKGLYMQMADAAVAAIRNGKSLEYMVANYVSAYTFFVGVQIKGLLCKIEILNRLNAKNNDDREKAVKREIEIFNKRIAEQSVLFMDGAELMITANAQNAAATFNYHKDSFMPMRQPISADPYSIIDEIAADSRGFDAQVVFRMLFDPYAPDRLWSPDGLVTSEGWWNDVYIRDYRNYFSNTGVKGMMQKLMDNVSGKHLPVYLNRVGGGVNRAINGDFGSVQKVSWLEPGMNALGKDAIVMRWVFAGGGVNSKDTYIIATDEKANNFTINSALYREGTIGKYLVNAQNNHMIVKMEGANSVCSITTFAWLPDNYHPEPGNNLMMENHDITMKTLSRVRQNAPAYIGWERIDGPSYSYMMTCDDSNKSRHHPQEKNGNSPHFFRQERQYKAYVYEVWRGILTLFGHSERLAYDTQPRAKDRLYFVPPPAIIAMFLNTESYSPTAKEPIYVRYGYPVFIGQRYAEEIKAGERGYWHWNYDNSARRTRVTSPSSGSTNHDAYWYLEKVD